MIRDRIKDIRAVKAKDLRHNPKNWRLHPDGQAAAVRGLLHEVGQVDILRAIETADGLVLVDGHLRTDLDPELEWKVAILDLTPEEADLVLATFDPVGAMAETDKAKLATLLAELDAETKEVAALLEELADNDLPADKPAGTLDLATTFGVLIHVPDEVAQKELLRSADEAGFTATAILTGLADVPKREEPAPHIPAGTTVIERQSKVKRSVRVRQVEGMFDLPKAGVQKKRWEIKLEIPSEWHVGIIVGPSGSGKSSLAAELFGDNLVAGWPWPPEASIVDGFPEDLSINEVTGLLTSVGFSSPPGWVKPFHVLSNGEQFRVNLARTLAEKPALAVVDEFTSVVDRTVARVGSHAAQKAIRATGRRLVAVSCHYDVLEWLQPDWVIDMQNGGEFARRSLRRRPELQVTVRRTGRESWPAFREHHYLSHKLNGASTCFVAEIEGRPAAFCSVIHQLGRNPAYRTHRLVTLPDFQGIGVGHALHELVAGMFVCRKKPYTLTSSHPAMIAHCVRSPKWRLRGRGMNQPYRMDSNGAQRVTAGSAGRMTTSFLYHGPRLPEEALRLGVIET